MIEERTFNNRYRLDRKLGEGGMATVFCGTDTLLRRRVAVKVLREQYAADEEFVRRFYQEAESAAKLSHPNIVNTYDVGREGDVYFIVMELVDGPSLAEIIAADGKLPEPVAIDYAAQICSGLAYAHRQGLLHRDIKPANILVTKDDVCKLSDFGIARAVSAQTMALTKPGLVMGSVYYISPEQAQGHELHESSDLYSVGVVLYQMLTGSLPFTGESPVTVALKHIGDPVPTIDTGALGTSPALASIVNRLLQKRPENRFQSAAEVASALREARERPSVAHFAIADDAPTAPFRAATPPPRRSPMPDRPFTSITEDEERSARSTTTVVVALVAALILATVLGYALFGKNLSLPHIGGSVIVGNYRGASDVDAQKAIQNAGLLFEEKKVPSDTVAANTVIEQNPVPGTPVDPNTKIQLIVSNGLPTVGLQDVTRFTLADATNVLLYNKFTVKVVRRHDEATRDTVIAQAPKPGTKVRQGSQIVLTVSDGPAPATMPDLTGKSIAQAQAIAQKLHFVLDTSQQMPSNNFPAGTIVSQDVASGSTVDPAAKVTVRAVVSTGPVAAQAQTSATVPDVRGRAFADATSVLRSAGQSWTIVYAVQRDGNGTIVGEEPVPGQPATGSVTLTLSVPGEVPDVQGMTVDQARSTLEADGYGVKGLQYTTIEGADGRAVRTVPEAGTTLSPGTAVTVVVNGTAP